MTLLKRIQALETLIEAFPAEPVLFTCGATSREAASIKTLPNHFYVLDSMGLVSSIGLGLSLALAGAPFKKCVVVEGDGGMLMNLSSLSTIGALRPENLLLVILDNQSYASTGGQPTITDRVDIAAIAAACGIKTWTPSDRGTFIEALDEALAAPGPCLVRLNISPGNTNVPYFQEDPAVLMHQFVSFLGSYNRRVPGGTQKD